MDLTAEQREKIYLEEKAKRESAGECGLPGSSLLLLLLVAGGIFGLTALLSVSCKKDEKEVSLEDLRRAYAGLGPEEDR